MKRGDHRVWRASVNDGRGTANVWIEDGYGRAVTTIHSVVGVHTENEAISAARYENAFSGSSCV